MKYPNIREEELKNKVAQEYFWLYDCSRIIGNVDFCVAMHQSQQGLFADQESLMWAEAKRGSADIYTSLTQLILTIGKARTFDQHLPPTLLGAFDAEKIAFLPYDEIHEVFYLNDFNWNVTPSNHNTKEFKLIHQRVQAAIDQKALLFDYLRDDKELRQFIKHNFVVSKAGITKTKIDKNNFMVIYNKWLQTVKPTIAVNWDIAKKSGIIDGDFYLADLLSQDNQTLKDKLFVLLKTNHYELDRKINEFGLNISSTTGFNDKQVAHTQFWNRYDRPPRQEYWDYIVARRDLLVPQDVRERKGSFFTPQIWVELSQKYLTELLGDDWQDEYYIWDCAAGTGNLLTGLTNKYNIWASTLDRQDVEVMHDRIRNGANLLDDHVFQFDFLNDEFSKLPEPLQKIINNPNKRRKLLIYINPPYAEVSSKDIKGKVGVNQTNIHENYRHILGTAGRELYAQFFIRVYSELNDCILAEFSKLKALQGSAFESFRDFFKPKLEKCFVVPADTFDNVKGNFPIGFKIWNTSIKEKFNSIAADVIDSNGKFIGKKTFYSYDKAQYINKWISLYKTTSKDAVGFMDGINGNDFQHNNIVYILNSKEQLPNPRGIWITKDNLLAVSIYHAVRHCIEATWLNDRDQFLYPAASWAADAEFQADCVAYTLFSNNIQSGYGVNHWIPFTEAEVNAREKFESNFMTRFLQGKLAGAAGRGDLFGTPSTAPTQPLVFSEAAQLVFEAGRALWRYYHQQPRCNVNAALYDIREHFQGRNDKGKMNNKSTDEEYMRLITALRERLSALADKIAPRVYQHGFLRQ